MTYDIQLATTAFDLVSAFPLINESIQSLHFKVYSPLPILEERLAESVDESVAQILEEASNLRNIASKGLFPYWESVLIAALATDKSGMFVREAAKHNPKDEASERFDLSADDLTAGALENRMKSLPPDQVIALCSPCTLKDGSIRHIPMMDYRVFPDSEAVLLINNALHAIDQTKGVILKSGRSYHFYGFALLDRDDWIRFLARSLLLAPLTDSRYIAHRLLEGAGALRISSNAVKPAIPVVEHIL
jgi:hypothetical protein